MSYVVFFNDLKKAVGPVEKGSKLDMAIKYAAAIQGACEKIDEKAHKELRDAIIESGLCPSTLDDNCGRRG